MMHIELATSVVRSYTSEKAWISMFIYDVINQIWRQKDVEW